MNKRKQLLAKIESEAEVENIASIPPYTIVELIYIEGVTEKTFRGVGLTKKMLCDVWDTERGVSIARGRAAKDIAKQMGKWFREHKYDNLVALSSKEHSRIHRFTDL